MQSSGGKLTGKLLLGWERSACANLRSVPASDVPLNIDVCEVVARCGDLIETHLHHAPTSTLRTTTGIMYETQVQAAGV